MQTRSSRALIGALACGWLAAGAGLDAQDVTQRVARVSTGMLSLAAGQSARLTVNEAGFRPTPTLRLYLRLLDEAGATLAERNVTLEGGAATSLTLAGPSSPTPQVLRAVIEARGPAGNLLLANAALVANLELVHDATRRTELAVSCPFGVLPSGQAGGRVGPFMCPPPCVMDFTLE